MNKQRILLKLEHDLSHFLIEETCKSDPTKRNSSDLYKYKGLSMNVNTESKAAKESKSKLVSIRIGALEAEFKIDTGDKASGSLASEDEKKIIKLATNFLAIHIED